MEQAERLNLFVPGRLCLFGEHSDWAGMHRTVNSDVVPGLAIVSGIEQGIYAFAEKSTDFIVESSLDIYNNERLSCEMDTEKLLMIAKEGGFFSYVAGVASYINDNYNVRGGVRIVITAMDLPIKSGLSSSAAICVLVARAFNQLYHLKMNTKMEMLVAFRGEQRTPSRCGRLDQACAYGIKPVLMEFDGFEVSSQQLQVGTTFYWVISELNGKKDTVRILSDLNKCYPFAESEKERNVHNALGVENREIVNKAMQYLQEGNAQALGNLMCEAQTNFDLKVAPASPIELAAPLLHDILDDANVKELTYGAKGVGSQGDGTVQFLAKDAETQRLLMKYLEETRSMSSFSLTLKPGQTIKKAVIPVAGFGTRLYPSTKVLKKSFMPLVDADGVVKPALLILLEQLEDAGIEQVCLIIGEDEREEYEKFFSPLPEEYLVKLSDERRMYEENIIRLGNKITFAYQRERLGFGHAVYQSRTFSDGDPVLLLLGDMVYESFTSINCSKQIINAYEKCGKSLVSIHTVPLSEVEHYGIIHGQWENKEETLLRMDCIYEKPTSDYASEYLRVLNSHKEEEYYAVFGQYVLTKEVYEELENKIKNHEMSRGEYQLTDALDAVRDKYGMYGFKLEGKSYDIGLPETYRTTMWQYGSKKLG